MPAMTIQLGDTIPDSTLRESTEMGTACPLPPGPVSVAEASKGKRIAIFALPGAYTATCSEEHLPGYVTRADALKAAGVDEIWCIAANDGYVMAAWGKDHEALGKIRMLGDAVDFADKLGLTVDLGFVGMGIRTQRFSMFVEDGVVKQLNVEKPQEFTVSDADTLLSQIGG